MNPEVPRTALGTAGTGGLDRLPTLSRGEPGPNNHESREADVLHRAPVIEEEEEWPAVAARASTAVDTRTAKWR